MDHEQRREVFAKKTFNLHKKECQSFAKRTGLDVKTASTKERHGIYYWVYLKPNWVLKSLVDDSFSDLGHPSLWRDLARNVIAPHYKITDPTLLRELSNIPYSMPRGRLANIKNPQGQRQFIFWNGNDFTMTEQQKKQLIQAFDLGTEYVNGMVRFAYDDHEVMLPDDVSQLKNIIRVSNFGTKVKAPKLAPDVED
jgi:hypothetical protein